MILSLLCTIGDVFCICLLRGTVLVICSLLRTIHDSSSVPKFLRKYPTFQREHLPDRIVTALISAANTYWKRSP
jgi:hypothetical protein